MKKYSGLIIIVLLLLGVFWLKKSAKEENDTKRVEQVVPSKSKNKPAEQHDQEEIPNYVYNVYTYVQEHGEAPQGYVGGRIFQNRENRLPKFTNDHRRIKYREWDVHPKQEDQNRGAERLITSNTLEAYYTNDHYRTFNQLKR